MKTRVQTLFCLIAATVFYCLLAQSASATTIQFTGIIDGKSSLTSGQMNTLEIGDRISGWFSYDPIATLDTNQWEVVGQYPFNNDSSALTLAVYDASDGNRILMNETGFLNEILVTNNWNLSGYPTIDGFNPNGQVSWNSEVIQVYLYFQNRNSGLDIIRSDSLPNTLPPFDQLNFTRGKLAGTGYPWSDVEFDIISASPVPEPGTLSLLTVGGSLLWLCFRRRRYVTV